MLDKELPVPNILVLCFHFRMVRTYKRKPNSNRQNFTDEAITRALLDLDGGSDKIRTVSKRHGIPTATLWRRWKQHNPNASVLGHPTALLQSEERALAANTAALGDYGMAFTTDELRLFVKHYLDKKGRHVACFKDNLPGSDWCSAFLKRHRGIITNRHCQNISRKRAAISENIVGEYFQRLKTTLAGVPPGNIINYDETNLTDDPKTKKMIFRRGAKHAERIMDTTKTSTSIMYACTAAGTCLATYVVYKGQRMQDTWISGGPADTIYNCSPSGWFDAEIFVDWFKKVIIPFVRRLPSAEPTVIIGDNLASHVSFEVIELCQELNIRMTFLPPNATHLLQPLDVGCFAPLKKAWRGVLETWKMGEGKLQGTLPKWIFPALLLAMMTEMDSKWPHICPSAFRACGIHPFDPEHVLKKMRHEENQESEDVVSQELLSYLKQTRESSVKHRAPRRKRLNTPAGASVSAADFESPPSASSSQVSSENPRPKKMRKIVSTASVDEESDEEVLDLLASIPEKDEEPEDTAEGTSTQSLHCRVGSYVLVRFEQRGKTDVHYVGKITGEINETSWDIEYYRNTVSGKGDDLGFSLPINPDKAIVETKDVVTVLRVKNCSKQKIFSDKDQFKNYLVR